MPLPIQPLGGHVVVKRFAATLVTPGGILIPDMSQERPARGIVVGVGEGRLHENGRREPIALSVGDVVVFGPYKGTEVLVDGQEWTVLKVDDIAAVEVETGASSETEAHADAA